MSPIRLPSFFLLWLAFLARSSLGLALALLLVHLVMPSLPRDLVPLRDAPSHRPEWTRRHLLELRARRELPVYRPAGGRRLYVRLADLDALVEFEPALRGPLAGGRS